MRTQGTLYRILKQRKFLLNCVIFGLSLRESMFIDEIMEKSQKIITEPARRQKLLSVEVLKSLKKKMFDFWTSDNPTTQFFVEIYI